MKNKWVIVENYGEKNRVNLKSTITIWEGSKNTGTGTFRTGVYLMHRDKMVIVETYSQWENRITHGCVGTGYHFADDDEIARLADDLRDDRLMNLVPEVQS